MPESGASSSDSIAGFLANPRESQQGYEGFFHFFIGCGKRRLQDAPEWEARNLFHEFLYKKVWRNVKGLLGIHHSSHALLPYLRTMIRHYLTDMIRQEASRERVHESYRHPVEEGVEFLDWKRGPLEMPVSFIKRYSPEQIYACWMNNLVIAGWVDGLDIIDKSVLCYYMKHHTDSPEGISRDGVYQRMNRLKKGLMEYLERHSCHKQDFDFFLKTRFLSDLCYRLRTMGKEGRNHESE